jgi:hypothetical protein
MAVKKTKIVDPKTGARVADPSFVGMSLSSGGTGTSWPEVRSQYQKGQRSAEFNRKGVPAELKSYLTGKTNKLSEDFDEPVIRSGGDVSYTRTAKVAPKSEFKDTPRSEKMAKMPTMKASITTPKGKLRDMKTQEFGQFEAPSAVTTKTKTKAAMTGGGSNLVRAKNPSGSLGAARVTTEKTKAAPGYNRERKQFEAFAKPLPTGGSLNVNEDTSPVIKRAQAEASQLKSAYRKEGNREGVKMMGAEAKQLGRAAKFADKMYEKGGGDYFTRDMVKGFRGSDANPANQNTIQRQEQLLNKRK